MRWDFRRYFGVPLSEVGKSVRYVEAKSLIFELSRESGSHLVADLVGLRMAASQADVAAVMHAEWFMNANRKKGSKLIELWFPMDRRPPEEAVTDQELAAAKSTLERFSAFG